MELHHQVDQQLRECLCCSPKGTMLLLKVTVKVHCSGAFLPAAFALGRQALAFRDIFQDALNGASVEDDLPGIRNRSSVRWSPRLKFTAHAQYDVLLQAVHLVEMGQAMAAGRLTILGQSETTSLRWRK